MTVKERYKSINEIPEHDDYIGYIWYSDAEKPIIIGPTEPFHLTMLTALPFVIEGHLFSERSKTSIKIKNIDGQHHFAAINLDGMTDDTKAYVGHDLGQDYQMVEAWEAYDDPNCADMPTLRPAWSAFAGFTSIHIEKNKL